MKVRHEFVLIIKLLAMLTMGLRFNTAHWSLQYTVQHGPKTWPWWRLVSFRFVDLKMHPPSTGYRLWLYTRWGSVYWDVSFDRRGVVQKRIQGWIHRMTVD